MELSGTKWNQVEPSGTEQENPNSPDFCSKKMKDAGTKWNQVELSGTKWDVGLTRQKSVWKAGEMTSRAVMFRLVPLSST